VIEPMNCPFCGSSDVGAAGGQVHCYHCPVILEVQNTNTFYAVELWNRRSERSEITSLKARVADLEHREDAMCDLHYANGAKQGFSWGQASDENALHQCVSARMSAGVSELVELRKAGGGDE